MSARDTLTQLAEDNGWRVQHGTGMAWTESFRSTFLRDEYLIGVLYTMNGSVQHATAGRRSDGLIGDVIESIGHRNKSKAKTVEQWLTTTYRGG